jgi:hypothetical protein
MTPILDYVLSTAAADIGDADLRTADEVVLRYDCFPGDIVLRAGDGDFTTHFGWVPVLDFALALRAIARKLVDEPRQVFTFTESDATLTFTRDEDLVTIRASYAPAIGRVTYARLSDAADALLSRMVADLTGLYPELTENKVFAELVSRR